MENETEDTYSTGEGMDLVRVVRTERMTLAWEVKFELQADEGNYTFYLVWDGYEVNTNRWHLNGEAIESPEWSDEEGFMDFLLDYVPRQDGSWP